MVFTNTEFLYCPINFHKVDVRTINSDIHYITNYDYFINVVIFNVIFKLKYCIPIYYDIAKLYHRFMN